MKGTKAISLGICSFYHRHYVVHFDRLSEDHEPLTGCHRWVEAETAEGAIETVRRLESPDDVRDFRASLRIPTWADALAAHGLNPQDHRVVIPAWEGLPPEGSVVASFLIRVGDRPMLVVKN